MELFFETKDLAVGYHGRTLIRDISMQIHKGEVVTLIGPNGSGKSTILKTITKHLTSIGGTVWIGRDELGKLGYRDLSKRVAVVLTERVKPELMTCRDVVASGRYPYTGRMGVLSGEDEAIVDHAMQAVNVLDLASRSYDAISDGQRQRILLARAICQDPEIIVLDEPTSFLDIRHKVELLTLLRHMAQEQGTVVILSLHEIDLAQKISDRVVCVHGDTISRFGTPEEVFEDSYIRQLYQLEPGVFNIHFGSVELPRAEGEPKTFVISACGSGIETYRKLQKKGIPFYAGILYTNDVDYQVAGSLAAEVVTAQPFCSIPEETVEYALKLLSKCEKAIICDVPIRESNRAMERLIAKAKEKI